LGRILVKRNFFKNYIYMKIIKKLEGSFCSDVYLVKLKGIKYVLKRCGLDEIVSEKMFNKELSKHGIKTLSFFDNHNLKTNEILLEYVEGSKTLVNYFTESNCKKWGEISKKIHDIKFESCFKYNDKGEKVELTWSNYLASKIKKAFLKSKENNDYGFTKKEIKRIKEYLEPLFNINLEHFSLIHGDFHTGNVLIKNNELIPFDKNPEIFTGDFLLDLAIAIVDMPNGTLMHTDNPKYANDKKCFNAFLESYNYDFLSDSNLYKYIMLIAFGRLYTPFSENYKDIIYNLLKKESDTMF